MISVILPNYNDADVINTQLDALKSQTVFPKELILIDDGSTDSSPEILFKFKKDNPDKNIRVLLNAENKGGDYRADEGLMISVFDYVYFCSSDDKLASCFIETCEKTLIKYNNPALCVCSGDILEGMHEVSEGFLRNHYIPGHCTVINKYLLLEKKGCSGMNFLWHSDHFLLHAIGMKYGVASTGVEGAKKSSGDAYSYANRGTQSEEQIHVLDRMVKELDKEEYKEIKSRMITLIKKLPKAKEYFNL